MANHIPVVEKIAYDMRRGFPDGTTELYKDIPELLARIEELETALVPFARVAQVEQATAHLKSGELVHVYLKDCVNAMHQLDSTQGIRKQRDNFFDLPAGGN